MVRSLLRGLALGGCAFVIWQIASPYVRRSVRDREAAPPRDTAPLGSLDEGWECVRSAQQASDRLASLTTSFAPQEIDDRRREALEEGRRLIRDAGRDCRCMEESCELATAALDELEEVIGIYDRMAFGDKAVLGNPAAHRARAVELLERARALALR